MENLIEKIIDKLSQRKEEQHNPIVRREFESAIQEIKELENEAEFEEVGRVMMKHLCSRTDLYHPHHTVIITATNCELLEGVKSSGKVIYIVD